MKFVLLIIILTASLSRALLAQTSETRDFKTVVEDVLKTKFEKASLATVCPPTDPVSNRILGDYGAIFVARGVRLPGKCIFQTEELVQYFQSQAEPLVATIGGVKITLQKPAMAALLEARADAVKKRLNISPRGGSMAASRSFYDTVSLWNSRFLPGLNYWVKRKRITAKEAESVRHSSIPTQIAAVLQWETKGMYFSKDLSKSILYSVAAPGASQHIFMLALDVEQFGNPEVRRIMARHGWFQTVKSDLPHFTFLGVTESELPSLGLKPVTIGSQKFWIPNID